MGNSRHSSQEIATADERICVLKKQRGREGAECDYTLLVLCCIHLLTPVHPQFHLQMNTAMSDSYPKYNKYTCFIKRFYFFLFYLFFFLLSGLLEVSSAAVTNRLQQVSLLASMLMAAVVTVGKI